MSGIILISGIKKNKFWSDGYWKFNSTFSISFGSFYFKHSQNIVIVWKLAKEKVQISQEIRQKEASVLGGHAVVLKF